MSNVLVYSAWVQIAATAVTWDWRVYAAFAVGQAIIPLVHYLSSVRLQKRKKAVQWAEDRVKTPLIRIRQV